MNLNNKCISIIGAGTMGIGISATLLIKGYDVILVNRNPDTVSSIVNNIKKILLITKIPKSDVSSIIERLTVTQTLKDIKLCHIVIECIVEDINAKNQLLQEIETHISQDCLIFTNTSSLSIEKLSRYINKSERFLGLHFMNPPYLIPFVEIINHKNTPILVQEQTINFVKNLEREYILLKDLPGFVVNRILFSMINEATRLVEAKIANIEDIDKSMTVGAGHKMGPFMLADLIGLDVCFNILQEIAKSEKSLHFTPSNLLKKYITIGALGRKTGKGFYIYDSLKPTQHSLNC